MTPSPRPIRLTLGLMLAAALSACGGSGATIGGTLSGLGSGLDVVLQNNGTDNLTLTADGSFEFATSIDAGGSYSVTVATQPVGQACSVADGSGVVDSLGSSVTSVVVTCTANSSLGGTVSGLASGTSVTLANAGVLLPIAANGSFAFTGLLTAGSTYSVTVAVQPVGQTCVIGNASGTVVANVMAQVSVTCS